MYIYSSFIFDLNLILNSFWMTSIFARILLLWFFSDKTVIPLCYGNCFHSSNNWNTFVSRCNSFSLMLSFSTEFISFSKDSYPNFIKISINLYFSKIHFASSYSIIEFSFKYSSHFSFKYFSTFLSFLNSSRLEN
jgi:hypothetical protein